MRAGVFNYTPLARLDNRQKCTAAKLSVKSPTLMY